MSSSPTTKIWVTDSYCKSAGKMERMWKWTTLEYSLNTFEAYAAACIVGSEIQAVFICFPHPSFALPRGSQSLGKWKKSLALVALSSRFGDVTPPERMFQWRVKSICSPYIPLSFCLSPNATATVCLVLIDPQYLNHTSLLTSQLWQRGNCGTGQQTTLHIKILYQTSGKHLTLHGAVITRWSLYIRHRFWFQTVGPTAPLKHWQCMHSFWKGHILLRNSSIYIYI